jgi:mono/diheme cytochrome c family protein
MANRKVMPLSAMALAAIFIPIATADDAAAARAFTLKVLPVLKAKCFACHGDGDKKPKGGLDMRSRAALLAGGDSGSAFKPGKPDESLLYKAVKWDGLEMPPKENDRLTVTQIETINAWIRDGAPWPTEEEQKKQIAAERSQPVTADGMLVKTSGGLSDQWTYRRYQPEDVWAFQPVKKPNVPATTANPIDHFVRAKLAKAGATPAPQADPRTLIRRATFDLIGLPPTPEETESFLAAWKADSTKAWEALIDRLLASPHYGERWAQHWFDVTRYADTGGMANDFERSNMWRYRDYVIRAFNADKPYDRFVTEQLAGDELADASALKRLNGDAAKAAAVRASGDYAEEEAEWIVATSFLRMGPWDNAMIMPPQARQIFLDDVVNAVGQTFLATTMRCFKCHDHKFDPLPTRDYYRMYAAFAGTQMAERPLRFLKVENRDGFAEGKANVEKMLVYATAEKQKLVAKREAAAKQWYEEHKLPYKDENARTNDPDEKKPPRSVGLDHVDEGRLKVREQDEWIWQRALERYQPMVNAVYDGADLPLAWNGARKLRMPQKVNQNWRPDSRILMGGALEAPGEKVQPGILSALGVPVERAHGDPFVLPDDLAQRRLGLAKWITDPRNPLTARAIVNRVWQFHFGKPIAGNPNNFGVKGAKPTHPEMLDWLAADFVDHGWTFKRLHKLILTSQAYRMSGSHPHVEKLRTSDPNNDLLAYYPPRRLTAEELRDAMLAISGELNPSQFGLPVMPEINLEVAFQPRMIQFSLAPAYQPSRTPQERNRRSIYAYRGRGLTDPFLELFNQPNTTDSCELRDAAAVSPQAFTLMNSDLMTDRSIALAVRVGKDEKSLDGWVNRAFLLILGRTPSAAEAERSTRYVTKMQAYHREAKPKAVKYPTRITRSLVEEFSGKEFEYEEILPVFEKYVPDTKPADVGAETRALADLCLLLLNSNEFIYLN